MIGGKNLQHIKWLINAILKELSGIELSQSALRNSKDLTLAKYAKMKVHEESKNEGNQKRKIKQLKESLQDQEPPELQDSSF